MKKFWMSMLCILALTFSVGFVGCSKDNSKDKVNDDLYTDNY